MFDFSFDLGSLVPSLVLALLAVVLPMLFRRIADGFLRRTKSHMASWLHILLESYVFPLAMILRVFLFLLAISMLPFVFVTDAKFQNVLDVGSDLLVIFFLGLQLARCAGFPFAAAQCGEFVLTCRPPNNGPLFENIFHALVVVSPALRRWTAWVCRSAVC